MRGARIQRCERVLHDAQRRTNYLQKQWERFRQFVIQAGYHAASMFCQTSYSRR
jgi:CRISPR/Cas system-associated protein endoribonuclease Cas2